MSYPHELLSQHPHQRLHERRRDIPWLAKVWDDPRTRILVVSGTRIRPVDGQVHWLSPAEAPDGVRVLLGERDDRVHFAVVSEPGAAGAGAAGPGGAEPRGAEAGPRSGTDDGWVPLRGLLPLLAGETGETMQDAAFVLHALGIAEWMHVTRHCPRDGALLEASKSGHELVCTRCGRAQFPRLDPAVIMLVTTGEPGSVEERALLGRQKVWPRGRFSTLAGFCEPGESLEDAVRREVHEEVGVRVGRVDYFGNQPWPLPASLMLGFTAVATSTEIRVDEVEIEEARWLTRTEMCEQAEAGTIVLPGGVSISRSLIEQWYGAPLPGHW